MKFMPNDDSLTIEFQGGEMLLALKRRLVIPRENIVDLKWLPEYDYQGMLLRIGGTGMPKVLYAGRFFDVRTKERLFLYVRRPESFKFSGSVAGANMLVIKTNDFPYAEVLLTCEPDIGASLMNWWG